MRSKSVKGNKGWLETTHLTWPLHPPKKQVVESRTSGMVDVVAVYT